MKQNWQSVDYWKTYYPELSSPFDQIPLTNQTIFLWNEMTTPLPFGSQNGEWGVFPEPKALVGFLKHVVLPSFFSIWLVREEWDENPEEYISLEELFKKAELSGKCRYIDDIPEMKAINELLITLFQKSDEKIRGELHSIASRFNKRWSDTPTWCFRIDTFDSHKEVFSEILNRRELDITDREAFEEELCMTPEEWTKICNAPISDLGAQHKFYQILEGNAD